MVLWNGVPVFWRTESNLGRQATVRESYDQELYQNAGNMICMLLQYIKIFTVKSPEPVLHLLFHIFPFNLNPAPNPEIQFSLCDRNLICFIENPFE